VTLVEWPEAGVAQLGDPTWVVRLGHETADTRLVLMQTEDARAAECWAEAGA
jgi:hypothetical protein